MRNKQEKSFPVKIPKNRSKMEFDGRNINVRSMKKSAKKKEPQEKEFTRGEQTDRKK